MKENRKLRFSILIFGILISFLIATLIIINLLQANIDTNLSDFLSGFTLGLGIVLVILLIILSSKRIRNGFEIAVADERNRIVKAKALSLSYKISLMLILFTGLILWLFNNNFGPPLVAIAIIQAIIGLICWGILNKIS